MEQRDLRDLICIVRNKMNWGCLIEASTRGLPLGFFTWQQIKSIEALREAEILDGMHKVAPKWREAIDEIRAGRAIYDIPDGDIDRIVIRACS